MSNTQPNDPAMPIVETAEFMSVSTGLTKREYFAALAMQGYIASQNFYPDTVAESAVIHADALIRFLNKKK
jgi:hypothetical protein